MPRCKDGAAVLIGLNRNIVGINFSGNVNDLGFVHTDQRTEHRHRCDRIRAGQCRERLTGDLTETLACDDCTAVLLQCELARDLHHQTAHQNREEFVRAVPLQLLLNLRKRHAVESHAAAPRRQLFAELFNLEQRALRGVGRACEVARGNPQAALCHHIGSDRAVDAAGEQQHGVAGCSDRQTACALFPCGVNICIRIADLDRDCDIRIRDIDFQMRIMGQQNAAELRTAQFTADLRRLHREGLVRTLCLNLKGLCAGQRFLKIRHSLRGNICKCLFAGQRTAERCNPEHLFQTRHRGGEQLVRFRIRFRFRNHVDRGLRLGIRKLAELFQPVADIPQQHILECSAVQTLQRHFAVFDQNDFSHRKLLNIVL